MAGWSGGRGRCICCTCCSYLPQAWWQWCSEVFVWLQAGLRRVKTRYTNTSCELVDSLRKIATLPNVPHFSHLLLPATHGEPSPLELTTSSFSPSHRLGKSYTASKELLKNAGDNDEHRANVLGPFHPSLSLFRHLCRGARELTFAR